MTAHEAFFIIWAATHNQLLYIAAGALWFFFFANGHTLKRHLWHTAGIILLAFMVEMHRQSVFAAIGKAYTTLPLMTTVSLFAALAVGDWLSYLLYLALKYVANGRGWFLGADLAGRLSILLEARGKSALGDTAYRAWLVQKSQRQTILQGEKVKKNEVLHNAPIQAQND